MRRNPAWGDDAQIKETLKRQLQRFLFLFGLAAFAEVKDRQQTRPAMRADDHAETGDGDPAHLRIRLFDLIAHIGGVIPAVGLQDPKLKTRGVNFAQVMQNAVYNGTEGGFPAADLFGNVQRTAVRHIENRLDGKQRADQSGGVGFSTSSPRPPEMQRVSITYRRCSGYSGRIFSAALLAFSNETDIFCDMSRKMTSFPLSSRPLKKS